MAGLPTLVRTGSKSVTVSWAIPDEHVPVACFQAELKASGWHAPWTVHNIFPIDVSVGDGAAELTVHNLEPNTAYQIRLVACFEQGDQHRSEVLPMRTFPLAPPVSHPPTVKCARHDRLLLRWNGPSVQADEIIGYRVSYFDCEQTWSSSTEVEAKFPGRLLTSSEQMSKFLSGAVATRVPIKTSDSDEGGEVEVLFWLMHLTSLRAYKVQVAAVTPGGVGQWSPKSAPLQTWRVAPRLSAPEQILCTHKSVFVALAVEPENIMGQDEEIVSFEVTLTPLAKGDELRVVTVSKEVSVQLAGRLHSRACTAPFLLLLDSLKPQSSYTCTARAVSHAGVGDAAQSVAVVTLPAAPDISELQVVRTWHDRVSIAWSVTDRCEKDVISELGEQVEDIGARSVRGFRIRVQQGKVVNETVGVRSRASNVSFTLPCLDQKTTYFVQVAPVTSEKVVGAWSNKVEFTTESLAPVIKCIDVLRVTRCGGILQWAAPEDLEEAPTIGYMISIGGRELDLPTLAWPKDTGEAQVWHEDGVMKATLGLLEPNTAHKIQVAARTVRGLGVKSAERVVQTRPCAPSISQAPILLQAFYNRLVLQCKLIPDWSADEESDVVGYRTRFYECGGFGISAWSEARDAEYAEVSSDDGPYVKLSFTGLVPERCYVAQVAAVTHQGQGPWSKQSERLSTWRAAPEVNTVRVLFRTHTQLVVGWSMDAPDCCDEEVEDFCIRASSRGEPMCMSVSRNDSVENALQWKSAHLQDCGMMLCDDSAEDLTHVGVVSALTPGRAYTCRVVAVTLAGEGSEAASLVEVSTLPAAPRIVEIHVDDVQHDQIQISWALPQRPQMDRSVCQTLDLSDSMDDLKVLGYSFRWSLSASWLASWTELPCVEVADIFIDELGRAHLAVTELQSEQSYIVDVRAHTARGLGEWCRVCDAPIVTAIVAPPPPAPEIVYPKARALAFSFAGVEDDRVVAYEVQRIEGWTGGWGRPSIPLRFASNSPAVRVTSEGRWIVTINQLRSDTAYCFHLRGVTRSGGVTKWSQRSDTMQTLKARVGDAHLDADVGLNDATDASLVQASTSATTGEGTESVEDFSKTLEKLLSFTMKNATAGVNLPTGNIPSISDQAASLLQEHGSRAAAARAAAIVDDGSWQTKLPDFLIQQVPVVGCPSLLIRELWRNIRRCSLIANLYGYDVELAETQALIFMCLLPGGGAPAQTSASPASVAGDASYSGRQLVLFASRAFAKETIIWATGLRRAAHMVNMLEAAGKMLKDYSASDVNCDALANASAKDQEVDAGGLGTDKFDMNINDAAVSGPAHVAMQVFRPALADERPVFIGVLVFIWLLPILVSVGRLLALQVMPLLTKKVRLELPMVGMAGLFIAQQVFGILAFLWAKQNLTHFVSFPATLVFVIYAIVPSLSINMAMHSVLGGFTEAPFFALLGLYNLGSGYLRFADDLRSDALLEQRPEPSICRFSGTVPRVRNYLWIILVVDFLIEELLGRVFGLHSFRILCLPLRDASVTLTENRTISFMMGLLAGYAQNRVLRLLQRRTVLLRLLGARTAMQAGLVLLLMGAQAVVHQSKTINFLKDSSPTPRWCCVVLWIRKYAAIVGFSMPLIFGSLSSPFFLGTLSTDKRVFIAVAVGLVSGFMVSSSFSTLWEEKREDLLENYRVLHLFPHMSAQARNKAIGVMRLAWKRGAEVASGAAVEWATSRVVRSTLGWLAQSIVRA